MLAKWLATEPSLLIVDEPTRGIDVGTKAEVHRLLSELAGQGIAILMISSELPEVLGMADRVIVVREGRITADIARADATAESVMFARHGHDRRARSPDVDDRDDHRGSRVLHALGSFARARETSILIALVLVIVVATVRNPTFLFSSDGFRDLLLTPRSCCSSRSARRSSSSRATSTCRSGRCSGSPPT